MNSYSYSVSQLFAPYKVPLVEGQEMVRALKITQEVTDDTQAAFLGFVPGELRLSCIQLACAPMPKGDLEQRPWIPMCIHLVKGLAVGGTFIVDFDWLSTLKQGTLERTSQEKLATHYAELLASLNDYELRAKIVAAGQKILLTLLNPIDLQQSALTACHQLEEKSNKVLQRFELLDYEYSRLWPDASKCHPREREPASKAMGRPIYTDLKVNLAIPKHLLEYSEPISMKPMVRFLGGGGTTGRGLGLWLYPADLELAEERRDSFVCDVELPLLPESDGTVIMDCLRRSMVWLSGNLQSKLQGINIAWRVDWDSTSLIGSSFGGGMALLAFVMKTPVRAREVVLRDPLLGDYCRLPGEYAGVSISRERASQDALEVLGLLQRLPYVLPRSGSAPPEAMWAGAMFSMSHSYAKFWKAQTVEEQLMKTTQCPNRGVRFFVRQASEDKHVNVQKTVNLVEWIRRQWDVPVDFKIHAGKAHGYLRSEPRAQLQTLVRATVSIAAEETGRPIHQDLQVKLAVPAALLDQSIHVSLKPMLRFPGGGGTTGHGQGLWLYPADFEQAEQRRDTFVCDTELPLLPESDGTVIMIT
ncbi:hypothetical protein T440DRAFT_545748 [Plenodomus tracheiphilus IPT5]|uniref:Alpha/beta-hydrolase n=1 Tax=Plenodomus tracheiphilus IPT5 TaxID=1408161 RepID=A0A6A7ASC5_9PLEO|nr:hypothetical protein T440DRAFT_545748 [Plenodomus tracheiphilus IPT5]